MKTHCWSCCGW